MNTTKAFHALPITVNTTEHFAGPPESIAAFFDLDGTLLPLPSLEKRFFRMLVYRRVIGLANHLLGFAETLRLLPRGIKRILYGNKMYLRGVRVSEADTTPRHQLPCFYSSAVERLMWHAKHGHVILIVSGTLQPLAVNAAITLEEHLAAAGIETNIGVYATRLEARDGKWTGRIAGEAMFGEAKARAIKQIAASRGLSLPRCFAYGDSASDRWMLESVGRPTAVNPSNDLARIATCKGWTILRWTNPPRSARNWVGTTSLCTDLPALPARRSTPESWL